MRRSLNRAHLIGRAAGRPDIRTTQGGRRVATFSLATTRGGGISPEKTDWHRIVVWDDLAERASRELAKGQRVYVAGRLEYRAWEDRTGSRRHVTEIVAEELIPLDAEEAPVVTDWRSVLEPGPERPRTGREPADEELPF